MLPDDVTGLIFNMLTLPQLARTSSAFRAFAAVYKDRLEQEQAYRCKSAFATHGWEGIETLACLTKRWLDKEELGCGRKEGTGNLTTYVDRTITIDGSVLKRNKAVPRACFPCDGFTSLQCWMPVANVGVRTDSRPSVHLNMAIHGLIR